MLSPAAIGILRPREPGRSASHRISVVIAKFARSVSQAEQDLPGVECHWNARSGADHAALESALRKLNAHEPIEHAAGTLAEHRASGAPGIGEEGWHDVAR